MPKTPADHSKAEASSQGSRVSRRLLLAGALGATAAVAVRASAQAPGSVSPDRRRATGRAASRSGIPIRTSSRSIRGSAVHRRQHGDQAALHRHAVVRRAGVERRRPLSGLERHPEQRADALDRGRRPRHGVSQSVRQQQRQHVRLRGPAALVRARRPARRALRADGRVTVIAEKFKGKRLNSPNDIVVHPGRRHLVHRSDLRHRGNYEGFKARAGDEGGRLSRGSARAASRKVTDDVERPERHLLLARLQEALHRRHRRAARHQGLGRRRRAIAQRQAFVKLDIPGTGQPSAADGIRCDVDGNIWAARGPACRWSRRAASASG